TLMGAIKVLTDVLSLANPAAFGRSLRIKRYVQHMVRALQLEMPWRYEAAAMLSQVGMHYSRPGAPRSRVLRCNDPPRRAGEFQYASCHCPRPFAQHSAEGRARRDRRPASGGWVRRQECELQPQDWSRNTADRYRIR